MSLAVVATELHHSPLLPEPMILVTWFPLVPLQHWLHPSMDAFPNLFCIHSQATLELQVEL